jgi:glutamate/tyrosine decarboxylase-like PLP-dependent enzyme
MLLLPPSQRRELWTHLVAIVEDYAAGAGSLRVSPLLDPAHLREMLARYDFAVPVDPIEAVNFAASALRDFQVHTPHPRYYGLFNPAPTTMGIAADTLVAAFNSQLAAWSHSPFAAEVERHLIRQLGARFGYDPASADGTFCSGGAEANHSALLVALAAAFPPYVEDGARALAAQPVFYVSAESHHSFHKAARLCGIGGAALREVAVDASLRMKVHDLEQRIAADRAAGLLPFLVVGTAGTTNAGAIDPLPSLAEVARRERLWFHVDAAWGGAAVLSPRLRPLLDGIELSDSITFDAHKWMSAPMGAGLYLTRHREAMPRAFRTPTAYMPKEAAELDVIDPHLHSMQWSRRFIGLKVFLSLAVAGWEGYAATVDHMTEMGSLLRGELRRSGWRIENDTPLPVVCFTDEGGADPRAIVDAVLSGGEAWISTTLLAGTRSVLRACVTNYRTSPEDIRALPVTLEAARRAAHRATHR